MKAIIFGCGYVGMAVAEQLAAQGHEVIGVRRSNVPAPQLTKGLVFRQADILEASTFSSLPTDCDWVVLCVSASGGGVAEYEKIYVDGTRNVLQWLSAQRPSKFVYTSSTGVYGQDDGALVDESSPTEPGTETGKVLMGAEQVVLEAARSDDFPGVVLRLSGIYGPGRGYWLRQFLAGEARLEGDGSRFLNMIHREDAAGAIRAALERGVPGTVYNVSDNEPVRQRDLFAWLAGKLNRPMLGRSETPQHSGRRLATNKAISNRKMQMELGYKLTYPTFREGFSSELKNLLV